MYEKFVSLSKTFNNVAFALLLSLDAQTSVSSLSSIKSEELLHVSTTVPGLVVEAAREVGAPGADKACD